MHLMSEFKRFKRLNKTNDFIIFHLIKDNNFD